jgi:hypothetical protein
MTNGEKRLIAGKIISMAERKGVSDVERNALIAAAWELHDRPDMATGYCPSEKQMQDEGFVGIPDDWAAKHVNHGPNLKHQHGAEERG